MKKLFVLFLLVALVPFSVGCSLWGGDDDEVTYPPVLTAKVTVPAAGLSLRGADVAGTDYADYTLTLGDVTLESTTYEVVAGGIEISFRGIGSVSGTEVAGTLTGKNGSYPFVYSPGTNTGAIALTFDAAGKVTAMTVGGTAVPVAVSKATIVSVKNNDVAVSATTNVVVVDNNIAFTITGSEAFDVTDEYTYSVKVSGTAVTAENFTLTQAAAGTTAVITIPAAGRVAGKAYTVAIEYIKIGDVLIGATSYSFKMP